MKYNAEWLKSKERTQRIQTALINHHLAVSEKYDVIMTVLNGSQNYNLDTSESDYDTCSFVVPSIEEIAALKDPVSTMWEHDDGHINIKDIRLGLNLLKKTSPNSVEWFATKWKVVSTKYEDIVDQMDSNPFILRCNTSHMINAINGMSKQLSKRNMPKGKVVSHLIRMSCMIDRYFDVKSRILELDEEAQKTALLAKYAQVNQSSDIWNEYVTNITKTIEAKIKMIDMDYFKETEEASKNFITGLQVAFLARAMSGS